MVLKAKRIAVSESTTGNHGKTLAKAKEVISMPLPASGLFQAPVTTITRAVMLQITTVSMKGSSSETKPSRTGSIVEAAEWAIGAEPQPASLLKAARRKPWIKTPAKPPAPACQLKASRTMVAKAAGTAAAWVSRINIPEST